MKGSSVKFLKNVLLLTIIIGVYVAASQLALYFATLWLHSGSKQPAEAITEKTGEEELDSNWFDSKLLKDFIGRFARPARNDDVETSFTVQNEPVHETPATIRHYGLDGGEKGRENVELIGEKGETSLIAVHEVGQVGREEQVQEKEDDQNMYQIPEGKESRDIVGNKGKVDQIPEGKEEESRDIVGGNKRKLSTDEGKIHEKNDFILKNEASTDMKQARKLMDAYEKQNDEDFDRGKIERNIGANENGRIVPEEVKEAAVGPGKGPHPQSVPAGKGPVALREDSTGECPTSGVLTVEDGGRLGNKVWEYAAVWGLAKTVPTLRQTPYVPQSLKNSLERVFQRLTLPALESIPRHCRVSDALQTTARTKRWELYPLSTLAQRYSGSHIVLHRWIVLPDAIVPQLCHCGPGDEEFRFRRELRDAAEDSLLRARASFVRGGGSEVVTYVGVHVRRTDFATWLPRMYNMTLAGASYFHGAMDYFRRERARDLGTPLFLVVSDDVAWCRRELLTAPDVFLASKGPGFDLALLAACNHSIIDYGTFGAWGALMAGGVTVSLKSDSHVTDAMARMRGWIFLDG